MGTRSKVILLFFALGVVPVIALSVFNYLSGVRVIEARLLGEVERETRAIARDVNARLSEREDALTALARSPTLRNYVRGEGKQPTVAAASSNQSQSGRSATTPVNISAESPLQSQADGNISKDVQGEIRAFIQSGQKYYLAVTCLDSEKRPLFRAESSKSANDTQVHFQTRDFLSESRRLDERVWSIGEQTPLRSGITLGNFGSIVRYTIPVFIEEENAEKSTAARRGALIVELKLDALLSDAVNSIADLPQTQAAEAQSSPRIAVVVLDRAGTAIYHSNDALIYQPVMTGMSPSFKPVMDAMNEGQSGWRFYESPGGDDWLAAYQPLAPLELSILVAGDYSAAVRPLSWSGWLSIGLIALIGTATVVMLLLFLRRMAQSIKRVTEGAVAIAGGRMDERIEARSSDETRLLAESFNVMSDRLKEQIALKAESKQFESFIRLSAMLTHDLKNSITALTLIVSNMEQRFHNEEFRAAAMQSLRDATSQLGSIVAKLSEPVRSLSGEFKRPRPVDLVPVIRRALSRTAEPVAAMHEIDIQLPSQLVAVADDERIEKVFENLTLNAIEAMGATRGKLTVSAGAAEEGFVFFSVSDTGPGMTEEFQRTKLFHPFATTKQKGVGLGLYTCREFIRALGGRVEVESKRGSGTCFRIVLPSGTITEAGGKNSRAK
jgi:signal transduction histidine kinase